MEQFVNVVAILICRYFNIYNPYKTYNNKQLWKSRN